MGSNFNKGYNISLEELNKGSGAPEMRKTNIGKRQNVMEKKAKKQIKTNKKKVK